MLLVVGGLGLYAWQAKSQADEAKNRADDKTKEALDYFNLAIAQEHEAQAGPDRHENEGKANKALGEKVAALKQVEAALGEKTRGAWSI